MAEKIKPVGPLETLRNFAWRRKHKFPHRLIFLTHHKCASTWLHKMVIRICELNGLSLYYSHYGTARPSAEHDVSLLVNAVYDNIRDAIDGAKTLHLIRNPLNIVVSAYYSHLRTHGLEGWPELAHQRAILQNCNKAEGLYLTLSFLEKGKFDQDIPGPLNALGLWNFDDPRIRTARMEDMTATESSLLRDFLDENGFKEMILPDPEEFGFSKLSGGRAVGEVDNLSHYRSGSPDSWRGELPLPLMDYLRYNFSSLLTLYYPETLDRATELRPAHQRAPQMQIV